MNYQNLAKDNNCKSPSPTKEESTAVMYTAEKEFANFQLRKDAFDSTQSQIMLDSTGHHSSGRQDQINFISSQKKAQNMNIRAENRQNSSLLHERATSREVSDHSTQKVTEIDEEYPKHLASHGSINSQGQNHKNSIEANLMLSPRLERICYGFLQFLDLTSCSLEKKAIEAFYSNGRLTKLKSVNLAGNPLGNASVKFIAEGSKWTELQILILCNTQLDYEGIKWLAMNESWRDLKELDLSQNSLIGDLGAANLCANRTWTNLQKLSLWDCNVNPIGISALSQNKNFYRLLFSSDTAEEEFPRVKQTGGFHRTINFFRKLQESNWRLQNSKKSLSERLPLVNEGAGTGPHTVLAKLQKYKEKILNDTSLQAELNLFVEVEVTSNDNTKGESQPLDLLFEIRRHLLDSEAAKESKILLLTGVAGVGKTMSLKHLQREMLSDWRLTPVSDNENWFPIYIALSSLTNPNSEAIAETLSRELSLTDEEILLLKNSTQNNLAFPRLLFLFDGYDEIEDIHGLLSLTRKQEFLKHNFFEKNKIKGESWKNAKFIITCREQSLNKLRRRELLFGAIHVNNESSELSIVPGSLLQRRIEPFSNEQITCYLRRFDCFIHLENERRQLPKSPHSVSWDLVQRFEKMIDNHNLRDLARVPFLLWIMCQILPKLAKMSVCQINGMNQTQLETVSKRFLIDCFVNEAIKSNLKIALENSDSLNNQQERVNGQKENEDNQQISLQTEQIMRQAQVLALRLEGYQISERTSRDPKIDDLFLISNLRPLVTWDSHHSRVKFCLPFIREFLIGKSLEEEIREYVPSDQNQEFEIPKDALINQRLLTIAASNFHVVRFLSDALKDDILSSNQLMKLVYLSRRKDKELDQENNDKRTKDTIQTTSYSPFAVAAANAITIVNAAGYHFSNIDLSNLSVPGANLRCGSFESAIFTNANLQGVDFTGSWLRDADFVKADLNNVEFGEIPSLKLQDKIDKIAYSLNGKYFAAEVSGQTIVFENTGLPKSHLAEIWRLPGSILGSPFSDDEKQIVTIIEENIATELEEEKPQNDREETRHIVLCIWDIVSGDCVEELYVPIEKTKLLNIDLRRKEIVVYDLLGVRKYVTTKNSWMNFRGLPRRPIIWDVKDNNIMLLENPEKNLTLCNIATGKPILKLNQRTNYCKLSSDAKQIASWYGDRTIRISDSVRGHSVKSLKTRMVKSFQLIGQQILIRKGNKITARDVSDGKKTVLIPSMYKPYSRYYKLSINLLDNHFACLETASNVSFQQLSLPDIANWKLNLQGAVVNGSNGLSEENITLFLKKGDYGVFDGDMLKYLFPRSVRESENIREISFIYRKLAPVHAKIIGKDINWRNLQKLDLSGNFFKDLGGQAIVSNESWPNLEELVLKGTGIGSATAKKIATNQTWKHLKKLDLGSNDINDLGAIEIGKSRIWTELEILDLSANRITDEGATMIGSNGTWERLLKLDLSSNRIMNQQTLVFICGNKTWKDLRYLSLELNRVVLEAKDVNKAIEDVASESLEMLALPEARFEQPLLRYFNTSEPKNVKELLLAGKAYLEIHAKIIAGNTTWINLQKLDLSRNGIYDEEGAEILSNESWINLEEVDLSSNALESRSAIALGNNQVWRKLTALNLHGNNLGNEGVYHIAMNKTWTNLQKLDLGANKIGATGVAKLRENATWVDLRDLNLAFNNIGIEGAISLSKNTTWTNLETINLVGSSANGEGVLRLRENQAWPRNLTIIN